ncbi:MAG TPA: restriction endonuclease subunit S [Chryseolinea sp.]|nr:restriction endonuclease subunit S [Chryseolinea sp.]HPM31213.1 restriction endonuclease subunit S [Chryseolinea sp.]
MRFGLSEDVIVTMQSVFEANSKVDKVYVFGSRAKGNYKEGSDIDLAVKGSELSEKDILNLYVKLGELNLSNEIDLINYRTINEPALKEHIDRVGIEFYIRWKKIPLSKTTKFIVDNRGKTVPAESTGIPLIATNCIDNNYLYPVFENIRYISKHTYETWFRSHPEPGDIILTLKGSQNGAVCLVPDPVGFVIAQDMVALRANEKVIDPHFLFAALRSSEIQYEIKNLDVSGVIPHLKKSDFDKLLLPYPDLYTQKCIGNIYYVLSCKIDLLQRQNKTLSHLAETLFRQWFVEEKELGEIFELCSIASVSTGKGLKREEFTTNGEFPIIGANGEIGRTNKFLTDERLILTGRVGTLGKVYINENRVWISDNVLIIKPIEEKYFYPIYFSLLRIDFENMNVGSTQPLVTQNDLKKIELNLPSELKLEEFSNECSLFFRKINKNNKQIRILTQTRDALLPKLMSGEVRIFEANQ